MSVDKTRVSVTFTSQFIERMDRLVREGFDLDRQALIRSAVSDYLEKRGLPLTLEEAEG